MCQFLRHLSICQCLRYFLWAFLRIRVLRLRSRIWSFQYGSGLFPTCSFYYRMMVEYITSLFPQLRIILIQFVSYSVRASFEGAPPLLVSMPTLTTFDRLQARMKLAFAMASDSKERCLFSLKESNYRILFLYTGGVTLQVINSTGSC